jgi:hypothetical protein
MLKLSPPSGFTSIWIVHTRYQAVREHQRQQLGFIAKLVAKEGLELESGQQELFAAWR